MDSRLNCGKVTFKGKDYNVYRDPDTLLVWITIAGLTPTYFTNLHGAKAKTDEEARSEAIKMMRDSEVFV